MYRRAEQKRVLNTRTPLRLQGVLNESIAEVLGFFVGDGCRLSPVFVSPVATAIMLKRLLSALKRLSAYTRLSSGMLLMSAGGGALCPLA